MNPFLNFTALLMQSLLFAITYLPTKFFTRLKIIGSENLKNLPPGGVIVMANHASQLDPGLLDLALPWNTRFRPG